MTGLYAEGLKCVACGGPVEVGIGATCSGCTPLPGWHVVDAIEIARDDGRASVFRSDPTGWCARVGGQWIGGKDGATAKVFPTAYEAMRKAMAEVVMNALRKGLTSASGRVV